MILSFWQKKLRALRHQFGERASRRKRLLSLESLEDRIVPADWSGPIPNGTIWDNTEVQRIVGDVTIAPGATLTILPGTIVKLEFGRQMQVNGTLLADGTQAEPIIFTSHRDDSAGGDTNGNGPSSGGRGDWKSVEFTATSTGSVMDHVRIRFGGGFGAPAELVVTGSAPQFTEGLLGDSNSYGARIAGANPIFTNNTFDSNSQGAISMDLASNPNIQGVIATNNGVNGLVLDSGSLPANGTWDDEDIVYSLSGQVIVPQGVTLTMGAGQIVKSSFADLQVRGTLNAQGSSAQPVIFTSYRDDSAGGDTNNNGATIGFAGDWSRLEFGSTSTANVLEHVEVRYGGSFLGVASLFVSGASLTMTDSTIRNSSNAAIRIQNANPILTNTKFQDNFIAATMDLNSNPAITGVTVTSNGTNGLILDGGAIGANAFWNDRDIVYFLSADVAVAAGNTLTVGAGQIVKSSSARLIVNGTLTAQGTSALPIIFTSYRDDSAGGDTNNNGATIGFAGDWSRVEFNSTSTANVLEHVEIRYGGSFVGVASLFISGASLEMKNSTIRNSSNAGVRIQNANPILTNTTLQNNFVAVTMDLNSNPAIKGAIVTGNGTNGLILDSGTISANAFWDDPDIVYFMSPNITVAAGTRLTVGAGQVIKSSSARLIVDGTLKARGTSALPIVFTSYRDDSAGGDTNGNGATTGFAGDWSRVEFNPTSVDNVLEHVEVRFGGSFVGVASLFVSGASLTMTDSTIRNSSSAGVRIQNANPTLTNTTFQSNFIAATMDLNSNPAIVGVTSTNNSTNGLILDGGTISANAFWDDRDIVYFMSSNITVAAGTTLTVGAGQIVKSASARLIVDGTLKAPGTSDLPIIFTSYRDDAAGGDTNGNGPTTAFAGDWSRVEFNPTSVANVLEHVEVRFGGSFIGAASVFVSGASLTMTNSAIRNSSSAGLRIQNANPTLTNTTFQSNFIAATMDLNSNPAIVGAIATSNGTNGLLLDGGPIPNNATWDDPDIVYYLSGDVTLSSAKTLLIGAGQVIKSGSARLIVQGTLSAQGTTAKPIIFTSYRDDSAGGDTNGNGPTTAFAGDWSRVEFTSTSTSSVMNNVEIRYGGSFIGFASLFVSGAPLTFANGLIRDSSSNAAAAVSGGALQVTNSLIVRNGAAGLRAESGATIVATNNTIDGNGPGVALNAATATLTNNLITNNRFAGVNNEANSTLTAGFNDLFNPGVANYAGFTDRTGTNGNISADPKYFNRTAMQYQLRSGSPALDNGTSDGAPLTDNLGNSRFDDPNVLNQGGGASNFFDRGAFERQQISTSTIDLAVTNVNGPATGNQDQSVMITWTVANQGSDSAPPSWSDAVYLSVDTVFTGEDVLLGEFAHDTELGAGQSYTVTKNVTLPGILPGNYFFLVRANARYEIFEAAATANNSLAARAPTAIDVPALTVGAPLNGSLTTTGASKLYKIATPAGGDLSINLTGPFGATNELYIAFDADPTAQSFLARGIRASSADQSVSIANTRAGTYFVRVIGANLPSAETFQLSASLAGFGLTGISPAQGSSAGTVTLSLRGAQFQPGATVRLVRSSGALIPAVRVYYTDSGLVSATFDLAGQAPDDKVDVQIANPGGGTATLADSFRIAASDPGRLVASITVPDRVRIGRDFVATIDYSNVGNSDLVAPLLTVTAVGGFSTVGLMPDRSDLGASQELVAVNGQGPAGIMPPGARGRITLYGRANSGGTGEIVLESGGFAGSAIDYTSREASLRPAGLTDAQWNALFAQIKVEFGTSVGDYQRKLAEAATLLPAGLGFSYSFADVSSVLVERAIAALSPSISGRALLAGTTAPIANARVTLYDSAQRINYDTYTLNDGTILFPEVAPGSYALEIEGYTLPTARIVTIGTTDVALGDVTASPGGSIGGAVIISPNGVPLTNALVTAISANGTPYNATTNGVGAYRLTSLPPGIYSISVGTVDFPSVQVSNIAVNADRDLQHVNFVVSAKASIAGTLTGFTGALPTGGLIQALDGDGKTRGSAVPASNGTFSLQQLSAGTYELFVDVPGFARIRRAGVSVNAGQALTGVSIALSVAGGVSGTLKAEGTNAPLFGQFVELLSGNQKVSFALVDPSGNYKIVGIAAGSYTLSATVAEFGKVTAPVVVTTGNTATVNLVAGRAGTIAGTVRDSGGQILAQTIVTARDSTGKFYPTNSDATGAYRLADLPLGAYAIYIGSPGVAGLGLQNVSLSAGNRDAVVNLTQSATAKVTGRVFDSDGTTPLARVQVTLYSGGFSIVDAITDAAGRYSFDVARAGTYDVAAGEENRTFSVRSGIAVALGANVAVPDIVAGTRLLNGIISDAVTGQPIAGAEVNVFSSPLPDVYEFVGTVTSGADGSYSLGNLASGKYFVFVTANGHAYGEAETTLGSGGFGILAADVSLGEPTAIAGTVRDDNGQPLQNSLVLVSPKGSTRYAGSAKTDASGTYRVDGLPAGMFDVIVSANDRQPFVTLGVSTNTATPMIVNSNLVPSTRVLKGTITSGGQPVEGATVIIKDTDGRVRQTLQTGADGKYQTNQLSPGVIIVSTGGDTINPPLAGDTVNLVDPESTLDKDVAVGAKTDSILARITDFIRTLPVRGIEWINEKLFSVDRDPNHPKEPVKPTGPECQDVYTQAQRFFNIAEQQFKLWDGAQINYTPVINNLERFGNFVVPLKDAIFLVAPVLRAAKVMKRAASAIGAAEKSGGAIKGSEALVRAAKFLKAFNYAKIVDDLGDMTNIVTTLLDVLLKPGTPDTGSLVSGGTDLTQFLLGKFKDIAKSVKELKALGIDTLIPAVGIFVDAFEVLNGTVSAFMDFGPLTQKLAEAEKDYQNRKKEYQVAVARGNQANDLLAQCLKYEADKKRGIIGPRPDFKVKIDGKGMRTANSFDPNDKTGPSGAGSQGFIQPATMNYLVQFENDPQKASAPAQEVFITDTLDADLDLGTLEFTSFGFGRFTFDVPAGLSNYQTTVDLRPNGINLLVPVKLEVNTTTRVLKATFRSFDPATGQLPDDVDAGFLPVNNANHDGEGFFTYRIQPKAGLTTGVAIQNQASIVFDINAPLLTPTTLNTIDVGDPTSRVTALPAQSQSANIALTWSGSDDAGGAGIAAFDIFVSTDNGPFVPLLLGTKQTSASFPGAAGHSYAFYSVAVDAVGHRQKVPTVGDTSTFIVPALTLTGNAINVSEGVAFTGKVATLTTSDPQAAAGKFIATIRWGDGRTSPGTVTTTGTAGTFNVTGTNTFAQDGSYTVTVTVTDDFGTSIESANTATVADATPPPPTPTGIVQFTAASFTVNETAGSVTLSLSRTGGSAGALSVRFATADGTAMAGVRYAAASGTVAFGDGETSKSVTVSVMNDNLVETNQSFVVTLQGTAVGQQSTATVDVRDDDLPIVADGAPNLPRLQLAGSGFGKSLEHYRDFVRKAYQRFLSRLPDELGFTYWVGLMQLYETSNHQQGLRQEQIEAGFIASPEYEGRYGGVGEAWIRGIYQDLLGRAADPNGVQYWLGQLANRVAPADVALGFTSSDERLRNRVQDTYRTLLSREADAPGLAYWIAIFKAGGTTEDINSGFIGSIEYYNKPDKGGGNNAKWVAKAYADILFRYARVDEMGYWLEFLKG